MIVLFIGQGRQATWALPLFVSITRRSGLATIRTSPLFNVPKISMDVALPKLAIKNFADDHTEWQQFYDIFIATVDNQKKLSPVQKFM